MCLSIGPHFLTAITPMTPFLLCWPILNSMTPFFTFLKSWMTPPFYHFLSPNCPPPLFFLGQYMHGSLDRNSPGPGRGPVWLKHTTCIKVVCKFSKWFTPITSELFLSLTVFLAVLPACPQWPPFYNWLPNDPQFSGFVTQWPYFYCTWYGMAWFLLGLFTEWPHILESTHFTW